MATDIKKYQFKRGDRFFIDANVWLSVYGPIASCNDWRTFTYSAALRDMRAARCEICLDVLVLSEFINKFARLEFEQLGPSVKPPDFKRFRQSPEFRATAKEIVIASRKIVVGSVLCDSGIEEIDINLLLNDFETHRSDFNDQMIHELCKARNLTLVTHDGDFRSAGVPILTANRGLLN